MNKFGIGFGVMIFNIKGQILLGKRNDDKKKADSALHGEGSWTMPGGKLHFKETFEDGIYREVLEETAIELDITKLELISISNNIVDDAHFITLGFKYMDCMEDPKVMEPEEITEWGWFDIKELPSPIYIASKDILRNYSKGIIYDSGL